MGNAHHSGHHSVEGLATTPTIKQTASHPINKEPYSTASSTTGELTVSYSYSAEGETLTISSSAAPRTLQFRISFKSDGFECTITYAIELDNDTLFIASRKSHNTTMPLTDEEMKLHESKNELAQAKEWCNSIAKSVGSEKFVDLLKYLAKDEATKEFYVPKARSMALFFSQFFTF